MIDKIKKLVSIGKFRNYVAVGQVNFLKLTLIYGDNGGGKTTLSSVLRSLSNNNPEIIKSRISTNHVSPQAAQIVESTTTGFINHTFNPTRGWSIPFPNIEIFDIHFVNENIYSGFDFNEDHKKQLHQFVIGAQGIAIQQQIEQNKSDKTLSRQTQTNLENQLFQHVGNNLTTDLISTFLTIPNAHANNIDQKIASAEAALASANANFVIQTLPQLTQLTIINSGIDFSSLLTDLQSTTQSIKDEALQALFTTHCQELTTNTIDGPENWLQKGFEYINTKQVTAENTEPNVLYCPFCKQQIDNTLDIISAYAQQFDEVFNSLVLRIQNHLTALQSFNIETSIQSIKNVDQLNSGCITSWSTHLPVTVYSPIFNIIPNEANFRTELQELINAVQQKLQNPSIALENDPVTTFQNSIQSINTNIQNYNQEVTDYNSIITAFKASIQSIAQAQIEVDNLKRIEKRFEAPIILLCNQLKTERANLRTLELAYPSLIQQQQTAATIFFNSYKDRINHYLGTIFKTLFRIDDVVNVPPRGQATYSKIGYKLTIDGQDISFAPNQPFSAKECLSEGDKSTIALAFFLSKLDIDPNRQDKILVFDDPLSSLDTNRRAYTVGIIKALFQQMKQVVVLSHNENFLHEIARDFSPADKKTLRITENFISKASIIELCDLEELVKNDYFKHIEALEAFRINPNPTIKDSVLGWLRNVLESHLRFKFYKEIRSMTGLKTFGRLIDFLDSANVVFRDNINRTTIIANLKLINSISWMPHHGTPMPNYSSLGINPNSITASELDNLIQDTLNLIENQL